MTRTEEDLRAVYDDLDSDPASEVRLHDWLDRVVPTPARRRWPQRWAAVASAAAVAVVGVGIVALNGSGSDQAVPAGSSPTVNLGGRVAATPQVVVQTLLDLIPRHGAVSDLSGVTIEDHPQAALVYDDGHGPARIAVSLDLPSAGLGPAQCRRGDSCQVLADGTVVSWQTQPDPAQQLVGQMWSANAVRPDGLGVTVTEFTSPVPKVGPVTRAQPPFTVDELKSIVASHRWQATVTTDVAQRDATLFVPKPDTTNASTPGPTDGQTTEPPGTR